MVQTPTTQAPRLLALSLTVILSGLALQSAVAQSEPPAEPELQAEVAPPSYERDVPISEAPHSDQSVRVLDTGSAPVLDAPPLDTDAVVIYDEDQRARHLMPTEPAPLLYAMELVQSSWLRGPRYEVENKVFLSGGFPVFFVKSDFGPLEVTGIELLALRIEEFQALAELERISKLDVFGKSASRAVKRTTRAVKNVLSSPIETIKGVPSAIGRKVRETFSSAKESAKNLADQAREGMRNDDGDLIAANPFLPPPPPEVQLSEAEREAAREERAKQVAKKAGQSYIGYNKSRRDLARMLGLDPYSRNPLIMDRLDELAWSSLAGSAGTGLTLGALTGGASAVVSKSRQLNRLVWELPEEDLKKRNRDELKSAGYIDSASRALIRNGAFTTSLQTAYVDLLTEYSDIRGAQRLLELGAEARDELDARFLIHALESALQHQAANQRITRVRAISNQPVFEVGRRTLLIPAPADYLYLSEEMRAFLDLEEFRNTENIMLTHARFSQRLREELQSRRWQVRRSVVNNALPYAEPDA